MGAEFTTKCFRTWGGTVLAAEGLATRHDGSTDVDKVVTAAVADVAERLGNTPAVCRAHYIHPAVFEAHQLGELVPRMRRRHAGNTPMGLAPAEAAVLDLLKDKG
jgi:DNA topoisomerase-1